MILIVLFFLFCWYLWWRKTPGLRRFDLLLGWAIKLAACGLFVWIYTHYYGSGALSADPQEFMRESMVLARVADHSWTDYFRFIFGLETQQMLESQLYETTHWSAGDLTLINDSGNVVRVNSLICLFSDGDVKIHLLIISFLSLLGFREAYRAIYDKTALNSRLVWLMIIALPSVAFWTGSMLKEPFMMMGVCLAFRALFGVLTIRQRAFRFLIALSLLVLFKPYVLVCLLPAMVVYGLTRTVFRGSWFKALLASTVVGIIAALALPGKRQQGIEYLTRKQYDFINVGQGGMHVFADSCFYFFRPDQLKSFRFLDDPVVVLTEPVLAKQVETGKAWPFKDVWLKPDGTEWINFYNSAGCSSYIPITYLDNSFLQLAKNAPEAFVNAAFRPFFGDPGNSLKYFTLAETVLLFGWLLWQAGRWKSVPRETRQIIATLLLFSVMLFLVIGWITPVLGAIVRYRIPAYFALLIIGILLFQKRKEPVS